MKIKLPTPSAYAIVSGRGTLGNTHLANIEFRRRVRQEHERYDGTMEGKKHVIAREIVDGLYSDGYCFQAITTIEGRKVWAEIPRHMALSKTQQTLRDGAPARKKARARRKKPLLAAMDKTFKAHSQLDTPTQSNTYDFDNEEDSWALGLTALEPPTHPNESHSLRALSPIPTSAHEDSTLQADNDSGSISVVLDDDDFRIFEGFDLFEEDTAWMEPLFGMHLDFDNL